MGLIILAIMSAHQSSQGIGNTITAGIVTTVIIILSAGFMFSVAKSEKSKTLLILAWINLIIGIPIPLIIIVLIIPGYVLLIFLIALAALSNGVFNTKFDLTLFDGIWPS